jgi:hypothetical protein
VVDDEVDRVERVDLLRVAAERHDPVAHRREVDHRRHAGEVLHQHAGRAVGDLARVAAALRGPVGEGADVVLRDRLAVLEAQHVLEHDLERGGQPREGAEPGLLGRGDRVVGVGPAARGKRAAGLRRVVSDGDGHGCSQGCSSCPPADALLTELAEREDVIALALHVDYWDYIGWKDELARPEHTERQKGYARAAGKNMIYTPQFVIGGLDRVTGYEPIEVAEVIQKHRTAPRPIALSVRREGESILIEARATGPLDGDGGRAGGALRADAPGRDHARRERRPDGDYHNAVDLWAEIGRWDGQGVYMATARVAGDAPVAVIFQSEGYGPVLAAARVP